MLPTINQQSSVMTVRKNGGLHRDEDKPAIIYPNGEKEWWVSGERHRLKGAAVVDAATTMLNDESNEWYLYGKWVSKQRHDSFIAFVSETQNLEQFQSLPYEYQKNVFTALFDEDQ